MSIEIKASYFARMAHKDQIRKYTGEPYFVHCEEVAKIVESVGGTPEMIAAAYLHDVVEDTQYTIDDIIVRFGKDVADLVRWLTDVSRPEDGNRDVRKAIDREHTKYATPNAKTIKLADLISNTRSITEHDKDFAIIYMKEKEKLLPFLIEGNAELYARASEILDAYKLKRAEEKEDNK